MKWEDYVAKKKTKRKGNNDSPDSGAATSETDSPQEIPRPIGRDKEKKRHSSGATPTSDFLSLMHCHYSISKEWRHQANRNNSYRSNGNRTPNHFRSARLRYRRGKQESRRDRLGYRRGKQESRRCNMKYRIGNQ